VAANAEPITTWIEDLWIKAIYADDGPTFSRFKARPAAESGIIRRNTHLTVVAGGEAWDAKSIRSVPPGHRHRLGIEVVRRAQLHGGCMGPAHPAPNPARISAGRNITHRARAVGEQSRCDTAYPKPGIVIGKQGANVERLRKMLEKSAKRSI
jgi:hypothetical protein